MSGLTQMEFALAMITASILLLIARHWRFFLVAIVGIIIAAYWEKDDE